VAYQFIFSWDPQEEERELVNKIQKAKGISFSKGEKVYVTDYKWFLEWTKFVEHVYNVKLEYNQQSTHNYYSSKRRDSVTSDTPIRLDNRKSKPPAPGEIKNGCLLKPGRSNN
jgi:hypothetical protein